MSISSFDSRIPDPLTGLVGGIGGTPARQGGIFRATGNTLGGDFYLALLARGSAGIVLLMLATLVPVLAIAAVPSIRGFGAGFLRTTRWSPEHEAQKRDPRTGFLVHDEDGEVIKKTVPGVFGALPVIYGTVVSSALALLFAVPVSLGAALFLVRIGPWLTASISIISFLIEFLAAIPSIAYGIWGLFVVAPFLQNHLEPPLNNFFGHVPFLRFLHTDGQPIGRDMFNAGLILAIMILPIITAISRDVLRSVPRVQIEGTQALGATWWQSSWAMLRYGRSGLFGAVMLGLARAAGETMAVAMVIGNAIQIHSSIFRSAQTMSSLIANEFAEASTDMHRSALIEVALILLMMSLAFNVVARYLVVGRHSRAGGA
ncbi:MAG TPA: phosphate ABC transporter permease subunit PstC [Tepidisphaeraceae bacterium]|nr:phosphate ABC transporter permease subunit PstC [Tepidisphaeraceae bacterium]